MSYIGLTGSFGTGKSTVLEMLKELGAKTISADILVKNILKQDEVIQKIRKLFGNHIISCEGKPDINAIASIIFKDFRKRKRLEALIHPAVFNEAERQRMNFHQHFPNALFVFEVPLLFEGGYEKKFKKTIVIYCDRKTALNRLLSKGFSQEESIRRIKAQMPIEKKIKQADFTIDNSSTMEKTKAQVNQVYQTLLALYCKP